MCVPSLNEIRKSVFELSRIQVKTCGSGAADVKPIYPPLSSGDIITKNKARTFTFVAI